MREDQPMGASVPRFKDEAPWFEAAPALPDTLFIVLI